MLVQRNQLSLKKKLPKNINTLIFPRIDIKLPSFSRAHYLTLNPTPTQFYNLYTQSNLSICTSPSFLSLAPCSWLPMPSDALLASKVHVPSSSLIASNIVVLLNATTRADMLNAIARSTIHETTKNGLMEESMLAFLLPNMSTALSVRASYYNTV
jgi:hypothetical protein